MTITQKLQRRTDLAESCREEAFTAFRSGVSMELVQPLIDRYSKAARLVDLTAQKAIEERGR